MNWKVPLDSRDSHLLRAAMAHSFPWLLLTMVSGTLDPQYVQIDGTSSGVGDQGPMTQQQGFKSQLEKTEVAYHLSIYPQVHCELGFIERSSAQLESMLGGTETHWMGLEGFHRSSQLRTLCFHLQPVLKPLCKIHGCLN